MLLNSKSHLWKPGAAFLLLLSFSACSDSGSGASSTPTPPPAASPVMSNAPLSGATGVPLNESFSATFSEAMDPATLTTDTFTVTSGAVPIKGTVVYANARAVFWPADHLASNSSYTATITTGAKSTSGVALPANYAWGITTGTTLAPGLPVNLGTAGNFVILAKSGISTVPTSAITGNIGVSPIAATAITGFSLIADSSNVFSTSSQVTGKVYAADYAVPTPSNMTTAVGDMELAFTDAAGRAPDVTELGAGNIGGMTLAPGVYKWGTGLLIPTDVTLNGSATDVWIFEVAQNLTMASGTKIILAGGALPKNIFWQVSGSVDLGTTAHIEGVVLTQTAATLATGASINGRLLAQTAVTLDSSTVTDGGDSSTPTVLSNTPPNGAIDVPVMGKVSATFSKAMDPATLTASTFTLTSGAGVVPVQGTVTYANSTAVFLPTTPLASNTSFTATITTGAKSANIALPANYAWSFTTGGGIATTPTVLSNTPLNGATGVPINGSFSATFSEAMDPATLTASTFTLTSGAGAVPVQGTVTYANLTAVFRPTNPLASNGLYIATITTGAKSASSIALAANHAWSFTTGTIKAPTLSVNLGTAGNFVILTKSGISTVPTSAITGNIGVSPAAATYITGFSLIADSSNVFSTSSQITGKVFAADFALPTPSNMTTAVSDMELAFTDAAGRTADVTELGTGNIGGMTLAPGVYKWSTSVLIPTDVTLNGSATDVWIFEIAQNLTMANATKITLAGGALPKNIFWQVSGLVDIGTTAHLEGIVLTQTAVRMLTGSSINGRLLAQTAVSLDSSTVVEPAQ